VGVAHRPEQGAPYANPTLIVAGRQDATVGYAGSWRLLEHYPRATFAVLDRAGHGLPHEQVGLLAALLAEWLDRVDEHRAVVAAADDQDR
jgi:pimeloyl-ACP methyl ester carboxylesterase